MARRFIMINFMTKEERHEFILEQFFKRDSVLVSELAEHLGVSLVTVRKDLTELEQEGKLYRSHGRAIAINPFANHRSVMEKEQIKSVEKHKIGMEAAKLIVENDSIIVASGTTVHALANCIKPERGLLVVSASLKVSLTLAQNDNIKIVQLGGILRHSSISVVGDYCETLLEDCSFSKLFIGVDGIDFDYGITTTDIREAHLNRKMMKAAQRVIVLADSSKFGKRGFARICGFDDVDMIITDSGIRPNDKACIENLGIELVVAKMES